MDDPRKLTLLALGADDPDLTAAIGVVLEALQAEARLMTSADFNRTEFPSVLAMAHAKRLEALGELISEHTHVTWYDDRQVSEAAE